jgi:hypothetical protein
VLGPIEPAVPGSGKSSSDSHHAAGDQFHRIDRRDMYYLGAIVFAAMAIVLVVVFVRKFRQSND